MNIPLTALATGVWIACGVISAGFINAHFRGEYCHNYSSPTWARDGGAESLGIGIIAGPFGLIMSPFVTGFYQFGWSLSDAPMERCP